MNQYAPLSSRDGQDLRDYNVLHEGVPPWITSHLLDWLKGNLFSQRRHSWYDGAIREIELDLKIPLSGGTPGNVLLQRCAQDDWVLLNVVTWMLEHPDHRSDVETVVELLDRGGSVWKVIGSNLNEPVHLERRVNETLRNVAASVAAVGDPGGEHLRNAWREAWGVSGNANESYAESVRAVEAVLRPIVSPKNDRATLGTMIANMRQAPSKFSIRLEPRRGSDATSAFLEYLDVLWQSHRRHGEPDQVVRMSVDEARDAVSLAAHVVDWIQRGALALADSNTATGASS